MACPKSDPCTLTRGGSCFPCTQFLGLFIASDPFCSILLCSALHHCWGVRWGRAKSTREPLQAAFPQALRQVTSGWVQLVVGWPAPGKVRVSLPYLFSLRWHFLQMLHLLCSPSSCLTISNLPGVILNPRLW